MKRSKEWNERVEKRSKRRERGSRGGGGREEQEGRGEMRERTQRLSVPTLSPTPPPVPLPSDGTGWRGTKRVVDGHRNQSSRTEHGCSPPFLFLGVGPRVVGGRRHPDV